MNIPQEPLKVNHVSDGFVPDTAIHEKNGIYYHESSYSHFWFATIMVSGAIAVCFLPLETKANIGKLKYWIAGGIFWGGICGALPYFVRNAFGQSVTIDPRSNSISIMKRNQTTDIKWGEIIGLQLLFRPAPNPKFGNSYQLNLVWSEQNKIHRHCLASYRFKKRVIALGNKYKSIIGTEIFNQIKK